MTTVSDDFNRANELLSVGPWNVTNSAWRIVSNKAFHDAASRQWAVHTTALATDDQRAEAVWTSGNSGLLVRATSDMQTGYFCNIFSGAIREFWKLVAGSAVHLSTPASPPAISTGATMYMEVEGTTLRAGVVGGGEISITNSDVSTGKHAGLAAGGSPDVTLDDFSAEDLGGSMDPILVGTGSLADRIMAGLVSQGFTTGSISDRERARLLAKLVLPSTTQASLTDLYKLANEPYRLLGIYGGSLP